MFMASASDLLPRAQRLDLDAVREEDDRRLPDPALELSEVLPECCVLLELRLEVIEEALGLLGAVREDDLIVFVAIDGGVK